MPRSVTQNHRRRFLQVMGGLVAAGLVRPAASAPNACAGATPPQTEGPFYPVFKPDDTNFDLTRVNGHAKSAEGTVILVEGTVRDEGCRPVEKCLVEIWQACASGRYNHPGDTSGNPLDPDFQYRGFASTDAEGRYRFKTILPGHYRVTDTWTRPPHIHFKVHKRGFLELTTQLYFEGHPLNDGDLILQRVPESERERVVRALVPLSPEPGAEAPPNAEYRITFDIGLETIA